MYIITLDNTYINILINIFRYTRITFNTVIDL